MIQSQTILDVVDNSGAKTVKCLKVLNGFKKKTAKIGDFIVAVIKKTQKIVEKKKHQKPKRKEIFKALVVRTKVLHKKQTGFFIKFNKNSVILLDKENKPIGTRIGGVLPKYLKKKVNRLVSISKSLI